VAWDRVATNRGAKTAGSDGWTVTRIEVEVGVSRFLDDLHAQIKGGQFRPQPVQERKIPKPGGSGKVRRLGIPTVRSSNQEPRVMPEPPLACTPNVTAPRR
jgi:RNA-directed DNA polymerase